MGRSRAADSSTLRSSPGEDSADASSSAPPPPSPGTASDPAPAADAAADPASVSNSGRLCMCACCSQNGRPADEAALPAEAAEAAAGGSSAPCGIGAVILTPLRIGDRTCVGERVTTRPPPPRGERNPCGRRRGERRAKADEGLRPELAAAVADSTGAEGKEPSADASSLLAAGG